jgi:hypothetical protein
MKILLDARDLNLEDRMDETRAEVVGLQIASTEVHEIQHQVDGEDITIPRALFHLVPGMRDIQLARAAKELSAYLCELAGEDSLATAWVLAQLTGHLVGGGAGFDPYFFASGVILGRLLDTEIVAPGGKMDPRKVAALWSQLEVRGDELAAWASPLVLEAHADLLGEACAQADAVVVE